MIFQDKDETSNNNVSDSLLVTFMWSTGIDFQH